MQPLWREVEQNLGSARAGPDQPNELFAAAAATPATSGETGRLTRWFHLQCSQPEKFAL